MREAPGALLHTGHEKLTLLAPRACATESRQVVRFADNMTYRFVARVRFCAGTGNSQ